MAAEDLEPKAELQRTQPPHQPYQRDPDLPWYVRDPNHPATKSSGILISFLFLPLITIATWVKAVRFDPFTMTFMSGKGPVDAYAEAGTDLRNVGLVLVVLGLSLMGLTLWAAIKKRATLGENKQVIWMGLWLVAWGGAPFQAATKTEAAFIEQGLFTKEEMRGGTWAQILRDPLAITGR